MLSLHCEGGGRISIVDVPEPQPEPGDALVRVEASALCGSERPVLDRGFSGNSGHEACGVVVDPGGSGFEAGARVGLSAVTGCGRCDRCAAGRETQCRSGPRLPRSGWHAELVAVPASALRALPDGVGPAAGAIVSGDTLGVPVRALRRAPPEASDRVVILGLGPIGLGHLLVRSFLGAEVVAVEPSPFRRDLALALGAAAALAPEEPLDGGARLVVECTGRPDCVARALSLVEPGGVVLQSGECHVDVAINPSATLVRKEVTLTGSWYYASEDYPAMLDLVGRGLSVARLCTHEVAAADAQAAVTDFLDGRSGKVVLRWS